MLKRLLIATALGALATAAPAQSAQAGNEPQATSKASLQQRLDARFAQMDSNKDGSLSRAEVQSSHANFVKVAKTAIARRLEQGFTASDTNKDGKVSLAEMTAAAPAAQKANAGKALQRLDTDKDSHVSLSELTAAAPSPKLGDADQFMQRFDADRDGKVTAAEYPKPALAAFDRADTNKDGTISAAELKTPRASSTNSR